MSCEKLHRYVEFQGTAFEARRCRRMQNTTGLVMTVAAFAVIASVVMFGKGERSEPTRIPIIRTAIISIF